MSEDVPDGLGDTGRELWLGVSGDRKLSAPARVLLLNACRIADRCDELANDIGRRLTTENDRGDEVINPLISEHRQQYATLASILGKMGLAELPAARSGPSVMDQLAAKRAEREAKMKAA
mgnify:CR=1 FL=1